MGFTPLQILWYFLIFLLIAGYFALDGFDLGIGSLYPFITKDDREKAICRRVIGPVWDGNEVWLLTAGGALFAAFAPAYATTFSGFYLAIMLVLFGLIVRAVSLEFRAHEEKFTRLWDTLFFVGSLLPALLLGVAVGNVYAGVPLNEVGDYVGVPLLGLITPFTLLCGLLGCSMMLTAGCAWLALKSPKRCELRARAQRCRRVLLIVDLVLFCCLSLYGHFLIQPDMDPALAILRFSCAGGFLVCLGACLALGREGHNDLAVFFAQALAAILLVFLCAFTMFPNLVVAAAGSVGPSIDIATAASSDATLSAMTVIASIGVPIVIAYHVFAYHAFRGRLTDEEVEKLE